MLTIAPMTLHTSHGWAPATILTSVSPDDTSMVIYEVLIGCTYQ